MANDLLQYLTSSAGLLQRERSYHPTFSPLMTVDDPWFDEGPVITVRTPSVQASGSLNNLSSSYPFVQGIEMTKQAQYDAGLVKIWSGEPQHRLSPSTFGQDKNFFPDPFFSDIDLFDPVRYLRAQEVASPISASIFSFPIVTGDNDQLENYNFNGLIEPLTIRPVIAFFSIETPFEAHTVRATLMAGNPSQLGGTEQVLTVDYFEPGQQVVGYLDMVDIIEGHPLNGYFHYEFTPVLPFVDARPLRNAPPVEDMPASMAAALSLMTGSTDNYVGPAQRSATSGWYYDNNASMGTDSLTFGGMTY